MKEILLKEYEPQEAKRRVLWASKAKWSVFSKRKKASCVWHVHVPRI